METEETIGRLATLLDILETRRPGGGSGEAHVIREHILPLGASAYLDERDEVLAYVVEVGSSQTLFSSHIDTVHSEDGTNDLLVTGDMVSVRGGGVLGADDGAGMWVMIEMIKAGVPGAYVFHRFEESGGRGSQGMAEVHGDFLARFKRAIAFDRKGTYDVITHQWSGRCCSDTFAESLATALSSDKYFYAPAEGVFTDTANYTWIIPECTNVSIGYQNEHKPTESLDVTYLVDLRKRLIALDWESLPTKRSPEDDYVWGYSTKSGSRYRYSYQDVPSLSDLSIRALEGMDVDDLADVVVYSDAYEIADLLYSLLH